MLDSPRSETSKMLSLAIELVELREDACCCKERYLLEDIELDEIEFERDFCSSKWLVLEVELMELKLGIELGCRL
jgi:hypothetical protein